VSEGTVYRWKAQDQVDRESDRPSLERVELLQARQRIPGLGERRAGLGVAARIGSGLLDPRLQRRDLLDGLIREYELAAAA
jgi:hypothetical protein